MKPLTLVAVAAIVSCSTLSAPSDTPSATVEAQPVHVCPRIETVRYLTAQIEACEARACETAPAAVSTDIPRPRVRVVQGAPRRCADEGPEVVPVRVVECVPGMLCLDAAAQLATARNLAAREAWERSVRECEAGP